MKTQEILFEIIIGTVCPACAIYICIFLVLLFLVGFSPFGSDFSFSIWMRYTFFSELWSKSSLEPLWLVRICCISHARRPAWFGLFFYWPKELREVSQFNICKLALATSWQRIKFDLYTWGDYQQCGRVQFFSEWETFFQKRFRRFGGCATSPGTERNIQLCSDLFNFSTRKQAMEEIQISLITLSIACLNTKKYIFTIFFLLNL